MDLDSGCHASDVVLAVESSETMSDDCHEKQRGSPGEHVSFSDLYQHCLAVAEAHIST